MAKSASPVRLQEDLMQAATLTGARCHRSAAEQVEYWASLGRQLAQMLDPNQLAAVAAGLARLRIEAVVGTPIPPEQVLESLAQTRETLAAALVGSGPRYQASARYPGYLEQLDAQGQVTVGQFRNGVFLPLDPAAR